MYEYAVDFKDLEKTDYLINNASPVKDFNKILGSLSNSVGGTKN